jgi:Tol biopolymer transport system component
MVAVAVIAAGLTTGAPEIAGANLAVGNYEILSVRTDETQGISVGGAGGSDGWVSVSDDGNKVVFVTEEQLDPFDTNDTYDIYLRDRTNGGSTTLVTKRIVPGPDPDELADDTAIFSYPRISGNGEYIVFASKATNLDGAGTNPAGQRHLYRYSIGSGLHKDLTPGNDGNSGGDGMFSVSDNGQVVAFASTSKTLLPVAETLDHTDVYVWTQAGGVVQRASATPGGGEANQDSALPVLSGDGKLLFFASSATDIIAGADADNTTAETYVRTVGANDLAEEPDVPTDALPMASSDDGGTLAYLVEAPADTYTTHVLLRGTNATDIPLGTASGDAGPYAVPSLSDNGRIVASAIGSGTSTPPHSNLVTRITNLDTGDMASLPSLFGAVLDGDGSTVAGVSEAVLVPADDDDRPDVFTTELTAVPDGAAPTGVTERVSVTDDEQQANGESAGPAMSASGNEVAFQSSAHNLVADDSGHMDVYVRNRSGKSTERVSVSSTGELPDGDSRNPAISASGRYVVFNSSAPNLAAGDGNTDDDVYLHDRQDHTTYLISASGGTGEAFLPDVSSNGRYVTFVSDESLLPDSSGDAALYLRDRQAVGGSVVRIDKDVPAVPGESARAVLSGPRINDDGTMVLFNVFFIGPTLSDFTAGLYRYDIQAGTVTTVIAPDYRAPLPFMISMSGDGSTAGLWNTFFATGLDATLQPWSLVAVGGPNNGQRTPSVAPVDLSTNGRRVMTIDDGNAVIWDRDTGTRTRVSETTAHQPIPLSGGEPQIEQAVIDGAGTQGAFLTAYPNVVQQDTNGAADIFAAATSLTPPGVNNPTLDVKVVAAPSTVPAPGGFVQFNVTVKLLGAGGQATIASLSNTDAGDLNAPAQGNTCAGKKDTVLTGGGPAMTCSFVTLITGTAGTLHPSTTTVTATVGATVAAAADEVQAAAVGDTISGSATNNIGVTGPGGTTGNVTTGGTGVTTGNVTTGGTGNVTTGGTGTGGTGTGGTGTGTGGTGTGGTGTGGTGTGGTAGTTSGATTTTTTTQATTTTTKAGATTTTTTVAGQTTTTQAGAVTTASTATTLKAGGSGLAKTGAQTRQMLFVALFLVGLGLILSGQGITSAATVTRRRR